MNPSIRHALRYRFLNSVYDPVVALTCREKTFKNFLLNEAKPVSGAEVLDLACGTGTFSQMLLREYPEMNLHALDADQHIINLAKMKMEKSGRRVNFVTALAQQIPFENDSLDLVFSSLFFHHLDDHDKATTCREVYRILKSQGIFYIADWGQPDNVILDAGFLLVRVLDGFTSTRASLSDELTRILKNAGFTKVEIVKKFNTMLGTIKIWKAGK